MDFEMDIDIQSSPAAQSSDSLIVVSESSAQPARQSPQSLSRQALSILRKELFPFLRKQIAFSLGDDMVSYYLPPDHSTTSELLRFILSKWIGVFADSPLSSMKRVVQNLYDTLRSCRGGIASSQSVADSITNYTEQILQRIGASSKAARLHQLTRSSPAHSPRLSPTHNTPTLRNNRARPPYDNIDDRMNDATDLNVSYATAHPMQPLLASQNTTSLTKMPVVLDGSNVAWRHGASKRFSIRGSAEALQYFLSRGHPTVLFLPEVRLNEPPLPKYSAEDGPAYNAIKALEGSQTLITTPESDYDDSYICHFARQHYAVVVSNDAFADQVYQASADDESEAQAWKSWFAQCRLSFTFHGHTFIPNPCFNYDKAAIAAKEYAFKR